MPEAVNLRALALSVLAKNRDSNVGQRWDSTEKAAQADFRVETARSESFQTDNPIVPLSRPIGRETVGHVQKTGTVLGTVVGQSVCF